MAKAKQNKNTITKVMKYELIYESGCADFQEMQNELRKLQEQTREILNRTIQLCYHWDYQKKEYEKAHGVTPKPCDIFDTTGSLQKYFYHLIRDEFPNFQSGNINSTFLKAFQKYNSLSEDIQKGNSSIPSFKKDPPLIFRADSITISKSIPDSWHIQLSCFSKVYMAEHPTLGRITFSIRPHSASEKNILENILKKKYTISESQLVYEKKKWLFSLSYKFEPEAVTVDPNKILGVDMGICYAICAGSAENPHDQLFIKGTEALEQIRRLEARKKDLQKQARYPGEGRIGHGTKTRVSPVYKTRDYIARMQDTLNHRWSRALIDFALKNGYGTIQMEILSGMKSHESEKHYLKHWTYFDLQSKIKYKAAENGIQVVSVEPSCTSRRCLICGYISKENRKTQANFACIKCGYQNNADLNAAQNLSIPKIDEIIKEQLNKQKAEEKASANPK